MQSRYATRTHDVIRTKTSAPAPGTKYNDYIQLSHRIPSPTLHSREAPIAARTASIEPANSLPAPESEGTVPGPAIGLPVPVWTEVDEAVTPLGV